MGFIWNIYEKSFTPYFARLAPKHKVSRHIMQEKPCNLSGFWQNQRNKNIIRFVNRYVLQNSKLYYTSILAVALGFELFWKLFFRSIYLARNHEVNLLFFQHSLEYAQKKEKENLDMRRKLYPEEFEEEVEEEEVAVEEDEE